MSCLDCGAAISPRAKRCHACYRRAAWRRYYARHKARLLVAQRAKQRRQYAANPAKKREKARAWRLANPEKVAAQSFRAKVRGAQLDELKGAA